MTEHFTNTSVFLCSWVILRSIQHLSHEAQNDWGHYSKNQVNLIVTLNVSVNVLSLLHQNMMLLPLHVLHQLLHILCLLPLHILCRHQHVLCRPLHVQCPTILSLGKLHKAQQWKPAHSQLYLLLIKKKVSKYIFLIVHRVVTSQFIVLLAKKFPTRVMYVIRLENESILLHCNLSSLRKLPLCNQRLLHENLN